MFRLFAAFATPCGCRKCSKCGEALGPTAFSEGHSECKACARARVKVWYAVNRKEILRRRRMRYRETGK